MERLTERIGETTSLGILDDGDVVHVARISTHNIVRPSITVGSRIPAYASSMGRVLLGGLDATSLERYLGELTLVPRTARTVATVEGLQAIVAEVREQGWALVNEELGEGLLSVAAPVTAGDGQVIAALTVSSSTAWSDTETLRERALPELLRTVTAIDQAIRVAASGASLTVHL